MICGEHPASLSEDLFLQDVSLDFGRNSGPGGQHRNRKATACTATHIPSDLSGEATERRRQSENRKMAINRLRRTLAILLRRELSIDSYATSKLWESRRQGDRLPINPKHSEYPAILAEVLDVLLACEFNMQQASTILLISNTQILKVVAGDKAALAWLNDQRKERDLTQLRT